MTRCRVAVALGTRPETVKLAPVIAALRQADGFETVVVATAQHRQLLDQFLSFFNIHPDLDLNLMQDRQSLTELSCRVLTAMERALREVRPDLLLVQGDTTTVLYSALAAFYQDIPVAHVEAGLRSHDLRKPFPEEANRALTSVLTRIHLAPTVRAREDLLRENVPPSRIVVTGNTVVDALRSLDSRPLPLPAEIESLLEPGTRLVLVTCHRRESWGDDLRGICTGIRDLAVRFSDVRVLYAVHPNPVVQEEAARILGGAPRVHLTKALDYPTFIALLKRCHLVLTDSGGVQEEAPSFAKPVLVLRDVTERPEAAEAGMAKVIGTSPERIVEEASRLLSDPAAYRAMAGAANPYGDGHASARIVEVLRRWHRGESPWLPPDREFVPSGHRIFAAGAR